MTITTILFLIFIPILSIILLIINLMFAPHNAYQEKNSAFECGFHSFLGQNRTQFSISFFVFALLFLLFDLEILLVYPYSVSAYNNDIYGLITMLIFFLVLTLGFAFELGKNALKIDSRQVVSLLEKILKIFIKKSILNFFFFFQFFILFIVTYFVCNVFFIILINKGILALPSFWLDMCGPLYMNADPLDSYPEYKQINNLEQSYSVQQFLSNIKRDLETKLQFNKPECYKEIVDGLQRSFDNNLFLLQDPSKLHPSINLGHQSDMMKDLYDQIQYFKKEHSLKVEQFNNNQRNLAECNHRIQAISTKINQLRGSQF